MSDDGPKQIDGGDLLTRHSNFDSERMAELLNGIYQQLFSIGSWQKGAEHWVGFMNQLDERLKAIELRSAANDEVDDEEHLTFLKRLEALEGMGLVRRDNDRADVAKLEERLIALEDQHEEDRTDFICRLEALERVAFPEPFDGAHPAVKALVKAAEKVRSAIKHTPEHSVPVPLFNELEEALKPFEAKELG